MRVLILAEYNGLNSVIKNYADGIGTFAQVVCSIDLFWSEEHEFDIIHIHWPEGFCQENTSQDYLERLDSQFIAWKNKGTRIVLTRHNAHSHRNSEFDKAIYSIVFRYLDGVVHLGETSMNEFQVLYPSSTRKDCVINHPNYLNIPNNASKSSARKLLGLKTRDFVFMTFGIIRKKEEQDNLVKAFLAIRSKNAKLIVNQPFIDKSQKSSYVKSLVERFRILYLKTRGVYFNWNYFVPEDNIQNIINAADVVISPRVNQLNSGIVYLGFSFAKIVMGPDIGNIGEVLRNTSNVVFDPNNHESIKKAFENSYNKIGTDLGRRNFDYVRTNCDIVDVGKKHFEFYSVLLNKPEIG